MSDRKILIYPRICPWFFDDIINGKDPNISSGKISLIVDEFYGDKYKGIDGIEEVILYPSMARKDRYSKLWQTLNYIKKKKYDMAVILTSNTKKGTFSLPIFFFNLFDVKVKFEYNMVREFNKISLHILLKNLVRYILGLILRLFDFFFSIILLFLLFFFVSIIKLTNRIFHFIKGEN